MDDKTLSGYISTYGDRIAARRFCLENSGASTKESRKNVLLEKLKEKMGINENEKKPDHEEAFVSKRKRTYAKNNRWAEKKTRKIELGWIHEVNERRGGGMRTFDVPKGSKKADILQWEAFSHDILNYQEEVVYDEDLIIGELYSALKMGMLRFYLCTRRFSNDEDDEEVYDRGKTHVNNVTQLTDPHEGDEEASHTVVISSSESRNADVTSCEAVGVCGRDVLLDTSEVMIGPYLGEPLPCQLDDTVIDEPFLQFEEDDLVITSITLPPTNTAEMISQFKDPALLIHPLKYAYIDEKGADADGVSRDVYAAFWSEFVDDTAEGEEFRVPSLSPKWQEEESKSMGRILLKGFQDHGYFPCLSDDLLFESLLFYLSQSDRDLITTALKEDLSDEDRDEVLDLMDRLDVSVLPTKENLKGLLLKVAHKQLIQKPAYAAEKMSLVASHFLKEAFQSPQDVLQMYSGLQKYSAPLNFSTFCHITATNMNQCYWNST
ncbi:olfactory receptor [Sarotherodon galilaeus]